MFSLASNILEILCSLLSVMRWFALDSGVVTAHLKRQKEHAVAREVMHA